MNVVIVGAGAMGGLLGYLLHRAGADVMLLEKDPATVQAIAAGGLRIEGVGGTAVAPIPIAAPPGPNLVPDLIFLTVKGHDTRLAIENCRERLGPRTLVVSLQNGIGNDDALAQELGAERVVAGATAMIAARLAPGHVRHLGWGDTAVAAKEPFARDRAERVADFLSRHGVKTTVADDLPSVLWGKALPLIAFSAVTALTRVRNGQVLELAPARAVLRAAIAEAVAVLDAAQIKLPYGSAVMHVENYLQRTADNLSTMLQEIYRGRRSEVEMLNGAVVELAQSLGLDAPVNRTLTLLVQAVERGA
jgi:2-dehydropantoate 2-reductase